MKTLAVIVAVLTFAAVILVASRPPAADGQPADTTTTTVTVPYAPLPDNLTPTAPAVRHTAIQLTEPPAPPTTVALTGCDLQRHYRIAAGLPERFDKIVYRESRCQADPQVRTSCCVGPSQLWVALHLRDHRLAAPYAACGISSEFDVDGPEPVELERHWCAVSALYGLLGYQPWKATA